MSDLNINIQSDPSLGYIQILGDWWLAGGISPANCIAAYQAIGATSLNNSYINLANPGTNDIIDVNAPYWNIVDGWVWDSDSNYPQLNTGVVAKAGYSVVVKFFCTAEDIIQNTVLGGTKESTSQYFEIFARRGVTADDHIYKYGSASLAIGVRLFGSNVMAMTDDYGYLNGAVDDAIAGDLTDSVYPIYLFNTNRDGVLNPVVPFHGAIQAVAIYDITLTDAQVFAITARLNAINPVPSRLHDISNIGAALDWYTTPSAVHYSGTHDRTYFSWINHYGFIQARYYDHDISAWSSIVNVDNLAETAQAQSVDDHNNPEMFILPNGTIQLRYAIHDVTEKLFQKISSNVEDISAWGSRTDIFDASSGVVHNYPHTKIVADNSMRLFYRRGPFNAGVEYMKTSTDSGATWSSPTVLINHGAGYGVYAFVANNGNQIHIAWNYQEAASNKRFDVYYMYSDDAGATWKKRDGTSITLPANTSNADLVFDSGTDQAYVWDICLDGSNNPYIVFAYKVDPNHEFRYASYNAGWSTHTITTSSQLYDVSENHFYSGGVVIDPNNVNTVYLSKKRTVLEIEKWTTPDSGVNWSLSENITSGSQYNNFRLQVIKNYKTGCRLIWCYGPYTGIDAGDWNGYDRVSIQSEL